MYGSLLTSKPRLVEPVYLAEIRVLSPKGGSLDGLHSILARRRATVLEEKQLLIGGGYGMEDIDIDIKHLFSSTLFQHSFILSFFLYLYMYS